MSFPIRTPCPIYPPPPPVNPCLKNNVSLIQYTSTVFPSESVQLKSLNISNSFPEDSDTVSRLWSFTLSGKSQITSFTIVLEFSSSCKLPGNGTEPTPITQIGFDPEDLQGTVIISNTDLSFSEMGPVSLYWDPATTTLELSVDFCGSGVPSSSSYSFFMNLSIPDRQLVV